MWQCCFQNRCGPSLRVSTTIMSAGPCPFDALPAELYQEILAHIPCSELQRTTVALRLALPRSPVPTRELFLHIQLNKRHQIPKLWMVLSKYQRSDDPPISNVTRSFVLNAWDPDADVLIKYADSFAS